MVSGARTSHLESSCPPTTAPLELHLMPLPPAVLFLSNSRKQHCAGGHVCGEVIINFRLLQENQIEEVHVKLHGAIHTYVLLQPEPWSSESYERLTHPPHSLVADRRVAGVTEYTRHARSLMRSSPSGQRAARTLQLNPTSSGSHSNFGSQKTYPRHSITMVSVSEHRYCTR